VLLHTKHCGPAFALIRPMVEAFLRLFLTMMGTDKQRAALLEGTYQTDFVYIGERIDAILKLNSYFGPWFKLNKDALHGFTHGGLEQMLEGERERIYLPTTLRMRYETFCISPTCSSTLRPSLRWTRSALQMNYPGALLCLKNSCGPTNLQHSKANSPTRFAPPWRLRLQCSTHRP
jgi:hypothetical protein